MKKLFKVFLMIFLLAGIAIPASADPINLIQNASFENFTVDPLNFDYWRESGTSIDASELFHTGVYSASLSNAGTSGSCGLVSNRFDITETGTYEFGAWFRFMIDTDPITLPGWPSDRPGLTASILIDGSWAHEAEIVNISDYRNASWTQTGNYWLSDDWFLIAGTFDASQICVGELNIYIQEYANAVTSVAFVDDAYVQGMAPVPEPTTMLLLGFGLLSFAGFRKKLKK